jgi:hypothetical protein
MRAAALVGLAALAAGTSSILSMSFAKAQSPDEMCRAITDAQHQQSCLEKIKPKQAPPVVQPPDATRCEAIADKQQRTTCLKQAGVPMIDCQQPQNPDDAAFCRQVLTNNPGGSAPDQAPMDDLTRGELASCNTRGQYLREECYQDVLEKARRRAEDAKQRAAEAQKTAPERTKRQEEFAANMKRFQEMGYKPTGFDDFKLDGKQLAATHAKLIVQGVYKKFGEIESLQPTGLAVAIAREYRNDNGIPLLTEDATRNVRAFFLQCGDNPAVPLGCPLTVVGHVDMCTKTSLLGSKSVPCLAVEDGF